MTETVLATENLHYQFRKEDSLFSGLELAIPRGSCFGLLGRNGAGKTTLMKLLCGLLSPKEGSIHWWGKNLQDYQEEIYTRIGLLIGAPRLYNHLSGHENLVVHCLYRQLNRTRIPFVLALVGLCQEAHKKVLHYSTGMRQRLGIAIALLHQPEFILLDEPSNGLDPQGIAEIRTLIQSLRQEATILVSSHLLAEVDQMCTHLAVLEKGQLLFQGTLEDMRARASKEKQAYRIDTAEDVIWPEAPLPVAEKLGDGTFRVLLSGREAAAALIHALSSMNIPVYGFQQEANALENSFLDLFKKEEGEGV